MKKILPTKIPHILHGADYNPEQWIYDKSIWDEDIRMMKLANCNVVSLGIFSWSALEPQEGKFDFSWMDEIIGKLEKNGINVILATPSGARPAWLAQKYPDVLRVNEKGLKNIFGDRHNHCQSSPAYRLKVNKINTELAKRYKDSKAVIMWHVSNEYNGECYCPLCKENFRVWLKNKYKTLEELNHQYWSAFWSHSYSDWSQIEPPSSLGDNSMHALAIDWKRFVTDLTIDFYLEESKPLREYSPNIPLTTNFMGLFEGLDYPKFGQYVDVASYDSYPAWQGNEEDIETAMLTGFVFDHTRSLKDKPFMLMESTPSLTNWQEAGTLKRPNQHILSSIQAIAHGSDTVQYFQWRKSRGGFEKFHGAVVDHVGHENTRVFKEVKALGEILVNLDSVVGTGSNAKVGIIYDWENLWAQNELKGLRNDKKTYKDTCISHYNAFWKKGINADIIREEHDFSQYKILCAPMLYMVKPNVAERIEEFVKNGGIFVSTYWSGIVNENDLCYLGGFPGPLKNVLGIWAEEIDTLKDGRKNKIEIDRNLINIGKSYDASLFCELIHLETAQKLAEYSEDFYKGMPALTVNNFGKGKAYYICFNSERDFLADFYSCIAKEASVSNIFNIDLPEGLSLHTRTDGDITYAFLMNFKPNSVEFKLKIEAFDLISQKEITEINEIGGFECMILEI